MEIHTQNMDLPIETYGNSNNVIKLFHNIEEDIYYPIKSKNKEKNKIIPPRKRSPIFNTNVHSDLNVLWKIDTNNLEFNKGFCQGILDCEVGWNILIQMINYHLNMIKIKILKH